MNSQGAELVCEGACNLGDVQRFDEACQRAGRAHVEALSPDGDNRTVPMIALDWIERSRKFKHTHHVWLISNVYQCVICRTERQYGNR